MQKKIMSAVLALSLVGSASVAFAGSYWSAPTYDVDVHASDSFNKVSDDDYLDVDVTDSFNKTYSSTYNSTSHKDIDLDLNVNKDSFNTTTYTKQGNYVAGHIVVQQFGGEGHEGGSGLVYSEDNSINYSSINSGNVNNSWNTTKSYNSSYTNVKDIDIDVDIHNSFNKNISRKSYNVRGMKKGN